MRKERKSCCWGLYRPSSSSRSNAQIEKVKLSERREKAGRRGLEVKNKLSGNGLLGMTPG